MSSIARLKTKLHSTEAQLALLLFVVLYLMSQNAGHLFRDIGPYLKTLGAEYGNIGQAIADGRGFSDPFAEQTGPTAWMPPLYPLVLGGLLALSGSKLAVAGVVVGFELAVFVCCGLLIYRIARITATHLPPVSAVFLFILWVYTYYEWFFLNTHDAGPLTLAIMAPAHLLLEFAQTGNLNRWKWGLCGALAAALSPAVLLAFIGLAVYLMMRERRHRRALMFALALTGAAATPWAIRNALTFHQFIPIKANLFFEANHANYESVAGVYDDRTSLQHPYLSAQRRFEYMSLGERKFLEREKEKFFRSLKDDPSRYLVSIGNRLKAVSVQFFPYTRHEPLRALKYFLFPLPFVSLFLLLRLRGTVARFFSGAVVFYLSYLAPYVLVAFYARYWAPLVPLLVSFTFMGADQAIDLLASVTARWRRSPTVGSRGTTR